MNNSMTYQQNIEKILAAVDKACPERKELDVVNLLVRVKNFKPTKPTY